MSNPNNTSEHSSNSQGQNGQLDGPSSQQDCSQSGSNESDDDSSPRLRISLGFNWCAAPLNASWNTLINPKLVPGGPSEKIEYYPLAMELSQQSTSGSAEFFSSPISRKFILSISQLGGNVGQYEPCKLFIAARQAAGDQDTIYDASSAWANADNYIRQGYTAGSYLSLTTKPVGRDDGNAMIVFQNNEPSNVPAYGTPGEQNWTVKTSSDDVVVLKMREGYWELSFWLLVQDKNDSSCTKVFVGDPTTCTGGGKCY